MSYFPGDILVIDCGSYSDRDVEGVYSCVKECDLPTLAKQYLTELGLPIPDKEKNREWAEIRSHRADPHLLSGFPPWLIRNGYWEATEHEVLSLGDYYFDDEFLR